jgi:TatD DNase family protein
MFLVDSHCHLDRLDLTVHAGKLENALAAAHEQGVGHMLCVCITLAQFPDILNIAKSYPHISVSVGLHPNEEVQTEPTTEDIIKIAQNDRVVAIGETGLDYYRSEGDVEWQRDRFRQHIRAAISCGLPLIIHSRQARADTLKIMQEEGAEAGVMHCFTEDWEMAKKALDMGFHISISGIVTFKNATEVQAVAKRIPLDRILIETDSPYLAPNPYRGKSNEPAYVRNVAEFIAQLRGIDIEQFAQQTTENFSKLFTKANLHV